MTDDPLDDDAYAADERLRAVPSGALALSGLTVGLLMLAWLGMYVFVFLPRGRWADGVPTDGGRAAELSGPPWRAAPWSSCSPRSCARRWPSNQPAQQFRNDRSQDAASVRRVHRRQSRHAGRRTARSRRGSSRRNSPSCRDCIVVPADEPVTLRFASPDVIHGILITGTNVNTMVMPGLRQPGAHSSHARPAIC